MNTSSPSAAYLRGHHQNLPLAFALAMCGCSGKDPVEAVQECLPDAPEEMAIGIHTKFEEMREQEPCICCFLLDSGITIQHHADALVALETELRDAVEANPTAGVAEIADPRKMIAALLRGDTDSLAEQVRPLIGDVEKVAAISARIDTVLSSLHRLTGARACLLSKEQKENAAARFKEMLAQKAAPQIAEDVPEEPVDEVEESDDEPEETAAPVADEPAEASAEA